MARNKVDTCFICGEAPCTCGGKKSTPKKTEPVPVVKPSFRDAMKSAAESAPPTPTMQPVPQARSLYRTSDEELIFNDAIRALAPILAPQELERYAAIIGTEPSTAERARTWKYRVQECSKRQSSDGTE
jgi:hypothetical protein